MSAEGKQGERVNLQEAKLDNANLQNAIFKPNPDHLPDPKGIAFARHLSQLQYRNLPNALVKLRKTFKESGLRKQEREITYAIKHSGFKNAWSKKKDDSWLDYYITLLEVCLGWFFFELTCEWGMEPERPLGILFVLIVVFSIPYNISLKTRKKVRRNMVSLDT